MKTVANVGFRILACAVLAAEPALVGSEHGQETPKPDIRVASPVAADETGPSTRKGNALDPLQMQAFNVALLLGEVHGGAAPDNLPAGAAKALADVREFLPYKSYRLLDTQWIRCCAGSDVTGLLRGVDDQQYGFQINILEVSPSQLSATFALADSRVLRAGKFANDPVGPPVKSLINSNFAMDIGETVVIGTSSLKGNRALVVLLTAVPRTTTNSKGKKGSMP